MILFGLAEVEFKRQTGRGFIAGVVLVAISLLALFSGKTVLVAPGGLLFLIGLVLIAPALVRPIASAFGWLLALVYARSSWRGAISPASRRAWRLPPAPACSVWRLSWRWAVR